MCLARTGLFHSHCLFDSSFLMVDKIVLIRIGEAFPTFYKTLNAIVLVLMCKTETEDRLSRAKKSEK